MQVVFLFSALVIAACGLIYELVAGALASYLLGDSITQFSTVIGVYLFAMGIGSYLSRYVTGNALTLFIRIEFLIGFFGGFSATLLFAVFAYAEGFRFVLYGVVLLIGTLVGLEIPLLMQILREELDFKELVAKVLAFDYIGALIVSILFPIVLAPHLGLVRTALLFGILNVLVGVWTIVLFEKKVPALRSLKLSGFAALAALVAGFVFSDQLVSYAEASMYPGNIVYAKSSPYQRLVVSREREDLRLYLNGHLQLSSRDEYRYHESLVHPALQALRQRKRVLVLGGGDGFAIREVLRYPDVESVTLVDLDKAVTELFQNAPLLRQLNGNSLGSEKLKIVNQDAFLWLGEEQGTFDFIVIDFPDPTNYSVGKLYTTTFFTRLKKVLSPEGLFVVQTTSPILARKSFWCVQQTIAASGWQTMPYHAYVPSFGEWGFVIGGKQVPEFDGSAPLTALPAGLRYLTPEVFPSMKYFPADMSTVPAEINRLDNQILVRYYDEEWSIFEQS